MIDRSMRDALGEIAGSRARFGEPLLIHTSMRVGGPADAFVEIATEDELRRCLLLCRARLVPFVLIGGGTNIIVRDGGLRGVVARLAGEEFSRIGFKNGVVAAGAAAGLSALAGAAMQRALEGIEDLAGIPGTVGGAARMNAGTGGVSFGECVSRARIMDASGSVREAAGGEMGFGYRDCRALRDAFLLDVELRLRRGDPAAIKDRYRRALARRAAWVPREPSAGCVFKNPAVGIAAGAMIDAAGLKGSAVGGAAVHEGHANVIVNRGGASAADVLALMRIIREKVRERWSVELEPEIVVIGEDTNGCRRGRYEAAARGGARSASGGSAKCS